MPIKCRYCDGYRFENSDLWHYLFDDDPLCMNCRKSLMLKKRKIKVKDMTVESFYVYEDNFRSMILQYKEAHDEALKDVFFHPFKDWLSLKYHGYIMTYVPSSPSKLSQRGFDHIAESIKEIRLEKRCLFEKREDRSQSAKGDHRLMEDNFRLKENIRKEDKILIVDDILTSGASMYGCYKLIKDKCRKVKCLTLAYSKYYLDDK